MTAIHNIAQTITRSFPLVTDESIGKTAPSGIDTSVSSRLASAAANESTMRAAGAHVSLRQPENIELPAGVTWAGLLHMSMSATAEQHVLAEKAALDEVQARMPAEEKNSPEVGERIKSDPRFAMLVALMLLFQQMVKTSRDESVAAVNRQLSATIRSGERTISGARDQLAGAIVAAVAVAGMSAMAAKNTMKGNSKIRTGVDGNTMPGHKAQGIMSGQGRAQVGGPKNAATLRTERTHIKDGSKIVVKGDKEGLSEKGAAAVKSDAQEMLPSAAHADQAVTQTRAQDYYAKGQAIQASATTLGVISSSGAETSAAAKRAEAQLLDNAAKTNDSLSRNEQDQAQQQSQSLKDTTAVLGDMLKQISATEDAIIRNV